MDAAAIRQELAQALTEDELDRVFRRLSKATHPDIAGGDGTAFLTLKAEYQRVRQNLSARVPQRPTYDHQAKPAVFDPYEIFAELGYGRPADPRAGLYLSLYRYHNANLGSWRIRTNPALRKRNTLIFRSVLWWADQLDPGFKDIFIRYDQVQVDSLKPTAYLKAGGDARRAITEGFDRFMRYQEEGRPGLLALARHSLETAVDGIEVYGLTKDGQRDFAQWLLGQLDLPPLGFQNSRTVRRR